MIWVYQKQENVQPTHSLAFSIQKRPTFNFPVLNLELLVIPMPSSTKLKACYLSSDMQNRGKPSSAIQSDKER